MTQLSAKLLQLQEYMRNRPQPVANTSFAPHDAPLANPLANNDEIKQLRLKIIDYEKKLAIMEGKIKEMIDNG